MTQIDNAFEAGVHVGRRIPLTLGNCVHTHNKEVKKILTLKTFFGGGGLGARQNYAVRNTNFNFGHHQS